MKLREHTKEMERINQGESQKSDINHPIPRAYLAILLIILLLTIAAIVGMALFLSPV